MIASTWTVTESLVKIWKGKILIIKNVFSDYDFILDNLCQEKKARFNIQAGQERLPLFYTTNHNLKDVSKLKIKTNFFY